jgi:predicted TIM-barrel fold metal-dependent hydrolase
MKADDRYVVISADAHAGADLRDYKDYLPSKWHEEFDVWADAYVSPFDDLVHATASRNWDSDFRLRELDADGISAEILFPNTIPPFFETVTNIAIGLPLTQADLDRRWAGLQAHNRWMVDFVSLAPTRRRGLVQIFPNDVDAAVEEITWAKETGAFGGVLLPAVPPGHAVEPLFHTRYEPLWRACAELGLPMAHHVGTGNPQMPMDQPASRAVLISEMGEWPRRTLTHLILAGVFERYPDIRFVPTELGTDWVLDAAAALDFAVSSMRADVANRTMPMFSGGSVEGLSLLPTEYVRRNVFYGASVYNPTSTGRSFEDLGVDRVMWGNDYPHEEGSTPQSREALRWAFESTSPEDTRLMVGVNAGQLYGFDLNALTEVAARIGPTVAEIHNPVEAAPSAGEVEDYMGRPFVGGSLLTRSRDALSTF